MRFSAMRTIPGVLLVFLAGCWATSNAKMLGVHRPTVILRPEIQEVDGISSLFDLRGGETRRRTKRSTRRRTGSLTSSSTKKTATGKKKVGGSKKEEDKTAVSGAVKAYKKLLPATKTYISIAVVVTALGLVLGEELAQSVFALDPMRVMYGLEIWRPITAATFLGPMSLSWAFSGYYIVRDGSAMERMYGSAQQTVFFLTQILMLSVLSSLLGQPFFTQPVITSMLYVLSRSAPKGQEVKLIFLTIPYWIMPYANAVQDVLQAKSFMALIPHVLGILSGHFYYFHKFLWPKMDGEDWLEAPGFLVKWLDADAKKDTTAKKAVSNALKARKRKPGRKLGGD